MKRFLPAIVLVSSLATLTGCVAQKQWRTQPFYSGPAATNPPAKNVEDRFVIPLDPSASQNRFYSMAFVEFKNDGNLWNPRQLEEAKKAIDEADRNSNHRALVVTFIHGWKNNARSDNNNVHDFREQMNHIAWKYCRVDPKQCGVVGIYVAWSGDLVSRSFNTVRTGTYANRRNTAADVALHVASSKESAAKAASSPLGLALRDIMKQVKEGPGRESNHSVVVGHSFGGLILEYAIQNQMEQIGRELHDELGKNQSAEIPKTPALANFADLVVLINQAAPADHAIQILSQYREDLQNVRLRWPPKKQGCPASDTSPDCVGMSHPLLLSISSESDLATRAVLPIAETVFPPKDRPRVLPAKVLADLPAGLDVKKVFTTAAAHTPQLYSHDLRRCDKEDCAPCDRKDNGDDLPVSIMLPKYAPGNTDPDHKDQQIDYCLIPAAQASPAGKKPWNQTPYWIFHIPSEVVPDHGTIFTDRFRDFLAAFMPPPEAFLQATPPPVRGVYRVSAGQ